jgi:hypothetical protein
MGQHQQPLVYAGRSKRAAVDTGQLPRASALHPSHEFPHHDPDHEGRADRDQGLVSDQIGNPDLSRSVLAQTPGGRRPGLDPALAAGPLALSA